jgi:hypothetical protein
VLLSEILPAGILIAAHCDESMERTHMTLSTLSMVRPPCICFMAVLAFCMASSVSLLIFAVSIL